MAQATGKTSAERVRQEIERDIVTGRLKPGARVDEEAIALRFGVSRTPVRDAILQLVATGLLEKQPRQGAIVAPFDLKSMVQMFEIMSEIEALCCRYAARRMTAQERQLLEEIRARSRALAAEQDLEGYFAAMLDLHLAIYAGSHNPYLEDIAKGLFTRLIPYRRFTLNRLDHVEEAERDHQAIVEAILASNPDEAARLMRKHVTIQTDALGDLVSSAAA